MKCDTKTMVKVGLAVGVMLAIAYVTLPAARAFISAATPLLLFLICPLSMLFMMKSMNSCDQENEDKAEKIQLDK